MVVTLRVVWSWLDCLESPFKKLYVLLVCANEFYVGFGQPFINFVTDLQKFATKTSFRQPSKLTHFRGNRLFSETLSLLKVKESVLIGQARP